MKMLMEHRLKESTLRTQLIDIQSKKVDRDLERADINVGKLRSAIRGNGHSVYTEEHQKGLIFLSILCCLSRHRPDILYCFQRQWIHLDLLYLMLS
jgi:hypothetical protein